MLRDAGRAAQGYLAHRKKPSSLGPPEVHGHKATEGSYGAGVLMIEIPLQRFVLGALRSLESCSSVERGLQGFAGTVNPAG